MIEDIIKLKEEFERIKSMGLIKSLRDGTTGVGYTFETLLRKEEDQLCQPDYGKVEIKCKLGYSKSPMTLFSYTPTRNGDSAIKYIFDNYSYNKYNDLKEARIFSRNIFYYNNPQFYDYKFCLSIDYDAKKIIMKSFKEGKYMEDVCEWDFDTLKKKLIEKMNYLAIVKAYPYRRKDGIYYKYLSLRLYKLKSFETFLKLIENDIIFVNIYFKEIIDQNGEKKIDNHGIAFKIKNDDVWKLFDRIKL